MAAKRNPARTSRRSRTALYPVLMLLLACALSLTPMRMGHAEGSDEAGKAPVAQTLSTTEETAEEQTTEEQVPAVTPATTVEQEATAEADDPAATTPETEAPATPAPQTEPAAEELPAEGNTPEEGIEVPQPEDIVVAEDIPATDPAAAEESDQSAEEPQVEELLVAETVEEDLAAAKAENDRALSSALAASSSKAPALAYRAHVQNIGWQKWVAAGKLAGTTGRSLRVEALDFRLENADGGIQMRSHVQNVGWQDWVNAGTISGTEGRGLRVEAIQVRLTGEIAKTYDVRYRVHVQNVGWTSWKIGGQSAGTSGRGLRLEGMEIKLVKRPDPSKETAPLAASVTLEDGISYSAHVQNIGWQDWVSNGEAIGTSGKALRMEALGVRLVGMDGGVRYRAHVQDIGWQGWAEDGQLSGTSGAGKRVEAFAIELTGEVKKTHDVWYRVHVQNVGWLGWAKNGALAGSEAHSYRMEAMEIRLQEKGSPAPGSTELPFVASNVWKLGWQNPKQYYQVSVKNTPIEAAAFNTPYHYVTPSRISIFATREDCIEAMIARAHEYLGTRYVWAGCDAPGVGVDCSGMVTQALMATGMQMKYNPYHHRFDSSYSTTTGEMLDDPHFKHVSLSEIKRGDLVFYNGHVAIYLGNERIIEATPPQVRTYHLDRNRVIAVLRPFV